MPPLTLTVFGASGATGKSLLQEALNRGHCVRAHCRPSSTWAPPQGVAVSRTAFDDLTTLRTLVQGCDAVVCLLGPRPPQRDVFCAWAARQIIDAMALEQVDRLLCLTGAMIAPDASHLSLPARAMATLFGWSRPEVAADRAAQEALVRGSKLRWTVFKPPRLTNAQHAGRVLEGTGLKVGLCASLPRGELAKRMLNAAEQELHIRQCVYLHAEA